MPTIAAMDREPQVSNTPAQLSKGSSPSSVSRQTEQDLIKSPEFHDLDLPDYIESSLQDFDIEELLQTDLSPTEVESDAYALESTFTSSTSPEDVVGLQEGAYNLVRTNTLSGQHVSLCSKQHRLIHSCAMVLLSQITGILVLI